MLQITQFYKARISPENRAGNVGMWVPGAPPQLSLLGRCSSDPLSIKWRVAGYTGMMPAPLPTSGAPLELQTWQELEDVFARLGQLARSPVAPQEFYRTVLDQSVRALSAEGGAVWLRASSGTLQLAVQTGRAAVAVTRDEQAQRAHQSLLLHVATEGHVV